ncbi:MFS transporter [Thiotrichales bacterium 19S9-12]|nr:MFS transporter [Thiotrichales bacterium 19S9-11]MCF6811049.1 MFS transporter [Thiotrichales bacterium 19S9-12]
MLLKYNKTYQNHLSLVGLTVVFLFSLFYCFDYFLQISISVFLDDIKLEFNLNDFQLGLMGSIFFIGYVAFQIPGGFLLDRFGIKTITLMMLICLMLGTLMMYLTSNYHLLLMARLLLGLGSSIAFLCAIKAVTLWLPMNYFSVFVGILQALVALGAILGQSPVAYLNQSYNWHELSGLLFMITCILFLLFSLISQTKESKRSDDQKIKKDSIIRLIWKVLTDRKLLKFALLSFISWSPVASLAGFWLIPMLKDTAQISKIDAGELISIFWIGLAIGAIMIPVISEWIKKRKPVIVVAFFLQLISMAMLVSLQDSLSLISISLFLLGLVSPIQGFIIVLARDHYQTRNFGLISGMLNMFGAISGGIMQLVIGGLLTLFVHHFYHPYIWAFLPYLILSLLGLYVSVFKLSESYNN